MKEIKKKIEIAYEEKGQLKATDLKLRGYANDTNERKLVYLSAVEDIEVEVEEEEDFHIPTIEEIENSRKK